MVHAPTLATEAVRMSVPARADLVHLLRTVTGSVSARMALSLDDIDDLRLAVDEACAELLALPGDPHTMRLDLRPLPGRIEVVLGVDAPWPRELPVESLGWQILGALADHVRFELWNGAPAIRIVKRTLGTVR